MRAVAKTLMIIFAVVEVGLGLKRTVTIAERDGNKEYVPSKEDQILGMLDFILAMQMIQAAMSIQKIERNMDYGNLGSDSERNCR